MFDVRVEGDSKSAVFYDDDTLLAGVDGGSAVAISIPEGSVLRKYSSHNNAVLGLAVTQPHRSSVMILPMLII